ncbi:MAG: acyl--CoA ligase [Pseudomonadales bacterium]|nr:acyl--CoA ligase [Pseudomonadales bacterium]
MNATGITRAQAIAELTAPGQPYELVPGTVFGRPCKIFVNAPPTLRELFEAAASDETFIVYDDERLTFREAWEKSGQVAELLVNRYGIGKGDRVAISMRNYPEWILAFMATTSMGAIAVAMNALWTPEEMAYGLKDCGAKVLFADQERIDRFNQVKDEVDIDVIAVRPSGGASEYPLLADLLADIGSPAMPSLSPEPEDIATLLYTSGSTGHPKGVASCHRNIIHALLSWELDAQAGLRVLGATPPAPEHQPATLLAVPLFHATGSHAVYLSCYRAQRKLVSMYKWDPSTAAELIEKERIASVIAPAAMTGDLVQEARRTNRDLSSLVSVGGGGAPRAPEQVKNIAQSFARALPGTGWGMTETNAIGAGIAGQDYLARPASSGRCSAVLELRVVNEKGDVLPAGERGELQVRGTSVFRGYWNRPDADAETFVDGGWMRTGDVAYLDDEGYLFIVDRIKDLVIRGGENIGCGEVEAALATHPDVLEASVYAVPDERLGEEVGATIYSNVDIDLDALRGYLAQHLAKFMIPRYIITQKEPLPRTASGKILKRSLRDEAITRWS